MKVASIIAELREIRAIALGADAASHRRADEEVAKLSPEDQSVARPTHTGTRIGFLLAEHDHIASRLEAVIAVATQPRRAGARR